MSRQARVAWALCALTVVLAGVHTWLFLGWSVARVHPSGWPELTLGTVLGSVLGALIVARRAGNVIGWLFVIGSLCAAVGDVLVSYDAIATPGAHPDPPAVWNLAFWLLLVLDIPQPVLFVVLLFLLFPDGRLLSPRWRWVAWSAVATAGLFVVVLALSAPPWGLVPDQADVGGQVGGPVLVVLTLALLVELVAAAACVVVRLRRAEGLERQQVRWLALFASTVAVGFTVAATLPWQVGLLGWLRVMPLHLGFIGVVIGAALAVLRYRLYDLDVVVSRVLVLAGMTALAGGAYVALVVSLGAALGPAVDDAFWPSLVTTAVVALAVQPLRRRIVRLADRLAFGSRAAPYEALAELGRGLATAPTPTDLLAQVAAAVGEASGAQRVTAELDLPGSEGGLRARWPGPPTSVDGPGGDTTELPVRERGDLLGRVVLVMPPGRPLRPAEQRVVEQLLAQTALALRNLRLETELARRVAELDRSTVDLRASRGRLVLAGDEEKARFTADLRRQVLPHLTPLPDRLAALADEPDRSVVEQALREGQESATGALDELRRLVRRLGPVRGARVGAGQRADDQAAASRSGPNADLVT